MVGDLPRHLYVFVDTLFTEGRPNGFVPAVWFGLVSVPGRVWGCTVLLESGAVYRNLPPHALAFASDPIESVWGPRHAQVWDCYGDAFQAIEYRYLAGLNVVVRDQGIQRHGQYLFTACPLGDAFSAQPEQAKEFSFIHLQNDRLTIQPTNNLLFTEASFTANPATEFPATLRRQTDVWSCE